MWTLSGIFRDVYVLGQPSTVHITDYHVQTPMEFDTSGVLKSLALDVTVHLSAMVRTYRHAVARCCLLLRASPCTKLIDAAQTP